MLASFRDLYSMKLKEKSDPRNKEVLETMETVLSAIPAESRTLPILYQNQYLGDIGAIALCETVKNFQAVNVLSLVRCAITFVSTDAIVDLIKCHPSLVAIDLSENTLGTTLLERLLVALKTNDHIERLGLRATEATDVVAEKLNEIMSENRTLHTIDLKNNKITQKGFDILYEMVKQHPHIIKLELQGNEISKEQLDKLAKVLERNDIILNTLNEILGHIRFKRTFSTRLVKGGYTPRYIKSNMTNNTNTITNSATNNSNSNNTTNDRDVSMSLDKEPVYNDVIIKNDSDQDKENENEPENNTQKLQSDDDNAKGKNENNNQRPSLPLTTLSDEFPWIEKVPSDVPKSIESSRFRVSHWEIIGRRDSMEDMILVHGKFRDKDNEDLYCVFDGHGGREVSDFCVRAFSVCFMSRLAANESTKEGIMKALKETYLDIDKVVRSWAKYVGSTALTAFIVDNDLFIANVGDTRAVLSHGGKAIRLSVDHKPDLPSETRRIKAEGGYVSAGRVKGLLSVSRAIGDSSLPQVTATPDIIHRELTDKDEFLILACDGLWDVLTDQQAVSFVRAIDDFESSAKILVSKAFECGSTDNISVVVVNFKKVSKTSPSSSEDTNKTSSGHLNDDTHRDNPNLSSDLKERNSNFS